MTHLTLKEKKARALLTLMLKLYTKKEMLQSEFTQTVRKEVSNGGMFITSLLVQMISNNMISKEPSGGRGNANKLVWQSTIQPNIAMVNTLMDKARLDVNSHNLRIRQGREVIVPKKIPVGPTPIEQQNLTQSIDSTKELMVVINKALEMFRASNPNKTVSITLDITERITL